MTAHGGWLAAQWQLTLTELDDLQHETTHLVEADVQWDVARRIVGRNESQFLERAPGAVTHLSDYSYPLRCLLN